MKKLIACLLLCCILITSALAVESTLNIEFDAKLTNNTNLTAREWFSDSYMRASLTVMLFAELATQSDTSFNAAAALSNSTFVGREGSALVVFGYTDGKILSVFYVPQTGSASYGIIELGDESDSMMEFFIDTFMKSYCTDGIYKNSTSDIMDVLELMKSAFSD